MNLLQKIHSPHIGGMLVGTNKKMENKFDYIEGSKFINIADLNYCLDPNYYNHAVFENTFNKNNLDKIDKEIIVVYTNTHWVENFFEELKKIQTDKKIVLITHNSDHDLNKNVYDLKPDNIIKWFSQNVNYKNSKNDIESIPIGLENPSWFNYVHKIENLLKALNTEKNIKNTLYVNHTIRSYPSERTEPYQLFSNKNWCTMEFYENGQNFNNYIDNIYNHKFILCPRGNGIDTHRFWETLYLKSIPIVIKNINNSYYLDFPILYVDKWDDITEDLLNEQYERIKNINFNYEKLSFSFWKNKILKYGKVY
jgi:hypothetical protein